MDQKEKRSTKNVLWIIFLTVFIDLLGFGILIPVIPLLLADPRSPYFLLDPSQNVSTGYIILGLLTAIFPLGQFFSTPILGQLSDKYGRKKLLVLALAGVSISYLLFAVGIRMRNIPLLFVSRLFHGIAGGNIAIAQAAIADVTLPADRAKNFGIIGAAFGLGFVAGPFLGGKLSDPSFVSWFSASTPFWFAAILSFINAVFVGSIFPETRKYIHHTVKIDWMRSIFNIIHAYNMPRVRPVFITNFLYQAGFTFMTTFFSVFLIKRFAFNQSNIGDFFAFVGLWIAFSQIVLIRIATKHFSEQQIIKFASIGTGISVLAYFLPQVWWQLLLVTPFLAAFNALTQSSIPGLVSRSVDANIQGEILGINASVQSLAFMLPSIAAGFVAAVLSPEASIFISSIILILSGIVFSLIYKPSST